MIWDELPDTFSTADVDGARLEASALEHAKESLFSLSDVLKQRREALKADGAQAGLLLIADGLLCDFMLTNGDQRTKRGPLGPTMEFARASIRRR